MLIRLSPLVLVMLAGCEPGGSATNTPSAIAPQDLVRAALESPGDGSDILDALAEFESAEQSRRAPSGLLVSGRTLEALARVPAQSRLVGTWRPSLDSQQETIVAGDAADACFGAVFDGPEAIRRFVQSATITFDADGHWSAPMLSSAGCEDRWRWKHVEDRGVHTVAWIGDSPYGSARNVTFAFASPNELEVNGLYGLCNRYTRVPAK